MAERVLVTGGAGYIGAPACEQLLESGADQQLPQPALAHTPARRPL
jgi:uncharacterized protein YbjT (DUF2867 family)